MGEGKAYTAGVAQRRMDEERMPYRSENTTYNSQVPVGRVYISSPFGVMDVNASHMELALYTTSNVHFRSLLQTGERGWGPCVTCIAQPSTCNSNKTI